MYSDDRKKMIETGEKTWKRNRKRKHEFRVERRKTKHGKEKETKRTEKK